MAELPSSNPPDFVPRAVNFVANHESKALLAGMLAVAPDRTTFAGELADAFADHQGDSPAWYIPHTTIEGFCEDSLMPAGVIKRFTLTRWRPRAEQADKWLEVAGCIGEWSLHWPELSVQQMLGSTKSVSHERTPLLRLGVYRVLLAAAKPPSLSGLADMLSTNICRVEDQTQKLERLGLLDITSRRTAPNPLLVVHSDQYPASGHTLENTRLETQALYAALGQLGSGAHISKNDLLKAVLNQRPGIDITALRRRLTKILSSPTGAVQYAVPQACRQTRVQIAETARKPIADLVDGITAIENGEDRGYARIACRLLTSPGDFRTIVAKARRFSPRANKAS